MNDDPRLKQVMDEKLRRVRILSEELNYVSDLLVKTAACPNDYFGIKMRLGEIQTLVGQITWLTAQIDALDRFRYTKPEGGDCPV